MTRKATTTQRGLGYQHQQQRAALLRTTPDGAPCPLCGKPMWKGLQDLDADHTVPRSLGGRRADRLTHASCNRSRGNGTRQPNGARTLRTSRDW